MNKAIARRGLRLAAMTLVLTGVAVAVNAIGVAATPVVPKDSFTSTFLGKGTVQSNANLPIKKDFDVWVTKIEIKPGGTSGWHSHPGGAIGVVQEGETTLTSYLGDNRCAVKTYKAGETVIENPGEAVNAQNTGKVLTVIYATFPSVPKGGSPRTDVPVAPTCSQTDDQGDQGNQDD